MCGRYTLYEADDLSTRYNLATKIDPIKDNYNVAPGHFMPVVVDTDTGPVIRLMKWGIVPYWSKDSKIGYKLINTRAETAFQKPTWKNLITKKRCLIPATGFYEWKQKSETKQPYFIHPALEGIFSFAGICESWKDAEGQELQTYSIMTTEPNKEMSEIHNRMPVILTLDEESVWLDHKITDQQTIETILHPYHDGGLVMHRVGLEVGNVKNNNPNLITKINS